MTASDEDRWRTWAEIDLRALRHNLKVAQQRLPGNQVIAVVKADAYGHGIEAVGRALAGKVGAFGVAALAEAERLSQVLAGPERPPILLLGPLLPQEMEVAIGKGWQVSVSTESEVCQAAEWAGRLGTVARVHLAVDTGMGRMGALESEFLGLCKEAFGERRVRVEGLTTHLPSADEDHAYTEDQLQRFASVVEAALALAKRSDVAPGVHVLNSAGLLRYGASMEGQGWMRPGLMLYGISPEQEFQEWLRPVMTLKTRVRLVRVLPPGRGISYGGTYVTPRTMRVATLSIGYGDGYPRGLSGQGAEVLIRGHRCPLLGRVTMDQIMVDVSALGDQVGAGEEVVVWGCQDEQEISVREVAEKAGTIPWEILTGVSQRVRRGYLE